MNVQSCLRNVVRFVCETARTASRWAWRQVFASGAGRAVDTAVGNLHSPPLPADTPQHQHSSNSPNSPNSPNNPNRSNSPKSSNSPNSSKGGAHSNSHDTPSSGGCGRSGGKSSHPMRTRSSSGGGATVKNARSTSSGLKPPAAATPVAAAPACAAPVAGPLTYAQHRSLQKARRRAGQRWCRWLTATKSRIGHTNGLRKRLGKARWAAFVAYANTHFKPAFVAKFGAPMGCAGPLGHAAPCPNGSKFAVDPTQTAQVEGRLATLHLDHRRDLVAVCEASKAAMPTDRPLRSWHDGVDPDLVCHLLFGVADHPRAATASDPSLWRANVEFRCGASKQHKAGNFCHQMWGSHDHRHPVTAEMLRV